MKAKDMRMFSYQDQHGIIWTDADGKGWFWRWELGAFNTPFPWKEEMKDLRKVGWEKQTWPPE